MKKKKITLKSILMVLLCLGFGLVMGALIGVYLVTSGFDDDNFLLMLAQMYLGMFIGFVMQIAIHEAGHLFFGLISGYSFSSYRIGSFMWLKENGKIRFCRYRLAGTGGQCLMIPPELVDGKCPTVLYHLGGCILNVVSGALLLIPAFCLEGASFVGLTCFVTAMIGFILALMNGIPMNNGIANDGSNALTLHKEPAAMRAVWLQLKINEQISRGVRPKDMPEEWFELPSEEEMKNPLSAAVGVLRGNRLLDEHRFAEADELMKHLLDIESGMLELHRNMVACDRITCCLLLGKEDEILNRMEEKDFVKFRKSMNTNPGIQRTEYIYALLREKDQEKAARALDHFEKCAKRHPYPSEVEYERELVELARSKGEETVC